MIQDTRRRVENVLACTMIHEGVERICLPIIQHSYVLTKKQLLWTVTLPPTPLLGSNYKRGSAFSLDQWSNFTQSSSSFHELLLIPSSVNTKLTYRVAQSSSLEKTGYAEIATVNYDSNTHYQNAEDYPFPVAFTFLQDTEPATPVQTANHGTIEETVVSDSERSTKAIKAEDVDSGIATDSVGKRLFKKGLKAVGTAAALLTGELWIPNFIYTAPIEPLEDKPTYKRKRRHRDTVKPNKTSDARNHNGSKNHSDAYEEQDYDSDVSSDLEDEIIGLTEEKVQFEPATKRPKSNS